MGELKYNVLVGGEIIQKKALRRDQEIYRLYTSFDQAEKERIKNPLMKWLFIAGGGIVLGGVLFYFTFFGGPGSRGVKSAEAAGAGSRQGGSVGSDLGSLPKLEDPVLCSMDYAAVGDEVLVYSYLRKELVPLFPSFSKAVIKRKGGSVVGVYCYLSGRELEEYRLARAPLSPPGGGGRGGEKEPVTVSGSGAPPEPKKAVSPIRVGKREGK